GGSRLPPTAETVAKRLHYVHQEGAAVYKFAVARMAEVGTELMARNNLGPDNVDWLVPHQANRRIIEATAERMNLPMARVMMVIEKYGNTTAATIPLCLWDYEQRLKLGDRLIMAAFGGGFTWAGAYLTWAYDGSANEGTAEAVWGSGRAARLGARERSVSCEALGGMRWSLPALSLQQHTVRGLMPADLILVNDAIIGLIVAEAIAPYLRKLEEELATTFRVLVHQW